MSISVEGDVRQYTPVGGNTMRLARLLRLVAAGALGTVGLLLLGMLLAATAPALGGYHMITVTGGSMGNALPVGSIAVTRTVDAESVHVGDIIASRESSASATVLHRVVSIESRDGERLAVTQGDKNATPDPLMHPLRDSGDRVVYYVPWIGYLFVFARSGPGLILAIAMVAALVFVPMWSRRRRARAGLQEGGVATP